MNFNNFKQGDEVIFFETDDLTGNEVQVADIVFFVSETQLVTRNGKTISSKDSIKIYPTGRHVESFIVTDVARQKVNTIRRTKTIPNPESEPE